MNQLIGNHLIILNIILCCCKMSKTNIEDLKKIANALKQKLSFINKNQDPIS
jgi:hypothetical protein